MSGFDNRFRKYRRTSRDYSTGSFPSLPQIDILRPSVHSRKLPEETGAFAHSAFDAVFVDCHVSRRTKGSARGPSEADLQAPGSHDSGARWSSSADRHSHSRGPVGAAAHSFSPHALRRARETAGTDACLP